MEGVNENTPLIAKEAPKTSWAKWYIVLIFSFFACENVAIWNTFGPTDVSAKLVYGWSDATITQFSLWGCLDFPFFFLPSAILLLMSSRLSVVCATTCMMVAATLRCLPLFFPGSALSFTALCHTGAFMNMMAGPIAMSAPTVIAAAWFPPNQRTLPTCIMQVFNFFGIGISNMLALVFITAKEGDAAGIKENLDSLLEFHMWTAMVISACIYAYFPSSPNSSPCPDVTHSQTSRRQSVKTFSLKDTLEEFIRDFSLLLRNKDVWILMIVYSLSQSLVLSWQSSTVIDFTSLHINFKLSEGFASSVGLRVGLISSFGSMLIAFLMDKFEINKKLALSTLFIASGIIFTFGTLITEGYIEFESQHILEEVLVNLYVVGVTLACSCAPIATTLCVEVSHPVSEGNTGSWLTLWFNLFALAFFLAFQIPNVGTEWLNFILPPCVIIPAMLLVCVRVKSKKREEHSTQNLVLPV